LEIGVFEGKSVSAKFSHSRGRSTQTIFARIDRPVFTQRNIVAEFFQVRCTFWRKTAILRFEAYLGA